MTTHKDTDPTADFPAPDTTSVTHRIAHEPTPSMTFQSLAWSEEDDPGSHEPVFYEPAPDRAEERQRAKPRLVPWYRRPQLVLAATAVVAAFGVAGLAHTMVGNHAPRSEPTVLDNDAVPAVDPGAPPAAPPAQQPWQPPVQQPPAQQPPAQQPPAAPPAANPPQEKTPLEEKTPPQPQQTCPDGTKIDANLSCPKKKNPLEDAQKQCWDGSTVPVDGTCPINPKEIQILCPDGTPQPPGGTCPEKKTPQLEVGKTCWNGSWVPLDQNCPIDPRQLAPAGG